MVRKPDGAPAVTAATAKLLDAYRAELLRWNRQISLVSRRDPEQVADTLIRQCLDAFGLWWSASGAALAQGGALRVFDLGSGGGLPGFVWLAQLAAQGVALEATLVEPRAKRAWFLERLGQLPGAPRFAVAAARWGEIVPGGAGPALAADTPILFTLKALRLPEPAILAGLGALPGPARPAAGAIVELVRFQPATGASAKGLARELEVPAPGDVFAADGLACRAGDSRLLTPARRRAEAAGLFVSRHEVVTI